MNKIKQLEAEYDRVSFIRNNMKCDEREKALIDNYLKNLNDEIEVLKQKRANVNMVGKDGVKRHAKAG